MRTAQDRVSEVALDVLTDPGRYPNRATVISADDPNLPDHVRRVGGEGRPIIIVAADGSEVVATPPGRPLGALHRIFGRRPRRTLVDAVELPAGYRVAWRGAAPRAARRIRG